MATAPPCSPLNDTHCDQLNQILELCSSQDQLLGLCHQIGLPVDQYVKENNQAKIWAQATKAVFFPHKP